MDSLLNKNRPKWETEIEQAFERLKKVEIFLKALLLTTY